MVKYGGDWCSGCEDLEYLMHKRAVILKLCEKEECANYEKYMTIRRQLLDVKKMNTSSMWTLH